MDLPERKKQILKAIIDSYIDTAEPVGSKLLANMFANPLSPATIRNEMSELEELGFLEKPHVSAGRVPSYSAYRLYVNELMESYRIATAELRQLTREIETKMSRLDNIMMAASKVVSEMTSHTAVSMVKKENCGVVKRLSLIAVDDGYTYAVVVVTDKDVRNKLFRLHRPIDIQTAELLQRALQKALEEAAIPQLLDAIRASYGENEMFLLCSKVAELISEVEHAEASSEIYVEGAAKLLSNVEYHDANRARELLEYLGDRSSMSAFINDLPPGRIAIRIGPENGSSPMRDASFVYTSYDIDANTKGIIGVVAPTRMDYAKACARLRAFAEGVPKIAQYRLNNQKIRSNSERDGEEKQSG